MGKVVAFVLGFAAGVALCAITYESDVDHWAGR